jgi:hypothetical protein
MVISTVCRTTAAFAVLVLAGLTVNLRESRADAAPAAAPSVTRADMLSWLADGLRGLWMQAGNSRWFYARFANVCPGLQSSNSLVFDTGVSNRIDRTSYVMVAGHQRCKVQTLVPSNGPPKDRNAGVPEQPQTQ